MAILPDVLIAARKAKRLSQADLAVAAGISQQTIGKLEKGTALTTKFLPALARALDVSPAVLDPAFGDTASTALTVTAPMRMVSNENTIPLFSSAEGSLGIGSLIISTEAMDYVPRPYTLEHVDEAYAILIEGESMSPAFEPGDMAWVNPMLNARRDHDVILYGSEDTHPGATFAMIKRMVSYTDAHWNVRQYNPPEVFQLSRKGWKICHRVVGKLSRR